MRTRTFFFLIAIYCIVMQVVSLGNEDKVQGRLYFLGALICLGTASILDAINKDNKEEKP